MFVFCLRVLDFHYSELTVVPGNLLVPRREGQCLLREFRTFPLRDLVFTSLTLSHAAVSLGCRTVTHRTLSWFCSLVWSNRPIFRSYCTTRSLGPQLERTLRRGGFLHKVTVCNFRGLRTKERFSITSVLPSL